MTPLHAELGGIYAGTVKIATVRPERAAQALCRQGHTPIVATAIAFGALARLETTKQLAAQLRLIEMIERG